MACSNKPSVSTRTWRFLPLISLPASKPCGSMQTPLFGALHALTIDDTSGGASFSFRLLAAFDVERVMNAIQHAVALPPNEVVVDCAARRKILRKVAPLAAGAQDIHDPVHDRTHVCAPLAATWFRGRNEGFNMPPLVIRQVARISQVITIVLRSVLMRPHRRSPPRIEPPPLNHKRFKGFNKFQDGHLVRQVSLEVSVGRRAGSDWASDPAVSWNVARVCHRQGNR